MLPKMARRWIAGTTTAQCLDYIEKLNKKGITGLVDFLGEHLDTRVLVEKSVNEYLKLLKSISDRKLDCELSVKLSSLGLVIDKKYCVDNLRRILSKAHECEVFVWIDMEEYRHVADVLDIYNHMHQDFDNVGVVVQSYLKRSHDDLHKLAERNAAVRLVKGAYSESPEIAFTDETVIRNEFVLLMAKLFPKVKFAALGTHDDSLIKDAIGLINQYHANVEFQFLMGRSDDLKLRLVSQGYSVVEYVPYGEDWLKYVERREAYLKRHGEK